MIYECVGNPRVLPDSLPMLFVGYWLPLDGDWRKTVKGQLDRERRLAKEAGFDHVPTLLVNVEATPAYRYGWPWAWPTQPDWRESLGKTVRTFVEVIEAVREAGFIGQIGAYDPTQSSIWVRERLAGRTVGDGATPELNASFRAGYPEYLELVKPVAEAADFVCPCLYLSKDEPLYADVIPEFIGMVRTGLGERIIPAISTRFNGLGPDIVPAGWMQDVARRIRAAGCEDVMLWMQEPAMEQDRAGAAANN